MPSMKVLFPNGSDDKEDDDDKEEEGGVTTIVSATSETVSVSSCAAKTGAEAEVDESRIIVNASLLVCFVADDSFFFLPLVLSLLLFLAVDAFAQTQHEAAVVVVATARIITCYYVLLS